MEAQHSGNEHIIEVRGESSTSSLRGSKCPEVCEFLDRSKDAEERSASMRKLCIAIVFCVIFMTVEVIGGMKSNSLALLTDAAHLLSDVAAFGISLFSLCASGWEATPRQTYGFFRIEILGQLVSVMMIWLLTGVLVYEAIARLISESTSEVQGSLMFAVSAFGLVVNIAMAVLLGHDHGHGDGQDHGHGHGHGHREHDHGHGDHHHNIEGHHSHQHDDEHNHRDSANHTEPLLSQNDRKKEKNINIQGAYLHVVGDLIQSLGVMVGGVFIWCKPEWKIIDLICTLVFSVLVLRTTITLMRNILEVLMESTPRQIDATKLEKGLCEMDEVVAVHDLHIWSITVGKVLLACHVTAMRDADTDLVLEKVIGYIKREYNISHVTIQIERQYITLVMLPFK